MNIYVKQSHYIYIIDKHKLKNNQNTETAFEFSFFTN